MKIISAREGGAGVMRTAEVVIVDELRLFHVDLLGDLVDRMAAYGGKGRLITASSAGYQDECKTTHELEKSDSRRWFLQVPGVRTGKHRRLAKRELQDAPVSVLCHAVLRIGAGGNSVPPRRPGRTMEGDKGPDGPGYAGLPPGRLRFAVRILADHRAAMEAGRRSPEANREHGRSHLISDRAPGRSRTNPRPRKA